MEEHGGGGAPRKFLINDLPAPPPAYAGIYGLHAPACRARR